MVKVNIFTSVVTSVLQTSLKRHRYNRAMIWDPIGQGIREWKIISHFRKLPTHAKGFAAFTVMAELIAQRNHLIHPAR